MGQERRGKIGRGFAGVTARKEEGMRRRDDGTSTQAGETGLMKSVCPVKVKINWRSGGGYRDNQPGPVVFKPFLAILLIVFSYELRSSAQLKFLSHIAEHVYIFNTIIMYSINSIKLCVSIQI